MQLPDTSILTKANAIISVIATIVYIVGFACPYWLVKSFILEAYPPIVYLDLKADVNFGLVGACTVISSFLAVEVDTCSSESDGKNIPDWHILSSGLAIAALILAVALSVLSVLTVVVPKLAKAHLLKLLTTTLTFITAGFIIAVLVIYYENKLVQVYPPHPQLEEFELGWAYLVTLASASAFVVLVITSVINVIWSYTRTGDYKIPV